jgi:DNA/RNA-binding domain of Phe-tRNA-synthetase-like protein
MLTVDPHPLLEIAAFTTVFPVPLGELPPSKRLCARLALEPQKPTPTPPFATGDQVRAAVRDLLRHGGYKPTGRGKPASEYLLRAAQDGSLGPINPAVDACNAVSLHSGLPVSVVDLDRAVSPLRIGIAPEGARYVFNASGQTIDLAGLLCIFDAEGPCANAVKDAQRTKTHEGTRRTLSVVWGTRALPSRANEAAAWYQSLLEDLGARTEPIPTRV